MSRLYDLFCAHPLISTDSRNVAAGSIFFALRGASFDGNRFAVDALNRGAVCAVVDDPELVKLHSDQAERLFLVDDVLVALQELAREHRRALHIPIVAIAGSNGKTTTKELTAAVLGERYAVYATRGNLNNHIGVPLTLLAMDRKVELGVVEMGASACGEIALLCSIAEPDCGLLTNIGRAHLEGFGGPEGIRRGKGELFDYLAQHGGKAFVPMEDEVLQAMGHERQGLCVESYTVTLADDVENQLEGVFNRFNIAAAMAVGRHFGIEEPAMRRAIAAYRPSNHRSQRMVTARNTLILDCYNANPSSMAASLGHFDKESAEGFVGKVVILGDMLELGDWSAEEHRRILRRAHAIEGVTIHLVGPRFAEACVALGLESEVRSHFSREELVEELAQRPVAGALILIKGSHSIGLEKLVESL